MTLRIRTIPALCTGDSASRAIGMRVLTTDRPWQCPIDGRVLSQRGSAEKGAAWCSRCRGVWLPGGFAETVLHMIPPHQRVRLVAGPVFDGHRCPEDSSLLAQSSNLQGMLEVCDSCSGLWLSGALLDAYRARGAGFGLPRDDPWKPRVGNVDLTEPLGELAGLIGEAAEAAGLSAADIVNLVLEFFSNA